jgi:hypothetical protein
VGRYVFLDIRAQKSRDVLLLFLQVGQGSLDRLDSRLVGRNRRTASGLQLGTEIRFHLTEHVPHPVGLVQRPLQGQPVFQNIDPQTGGVFLVNVDRLLQSGDSRSRRGRG